jgi:hypothetical protein
MSSSDVASATFSASSKKATKPAADKPEASSNQPTSSVEDVVESFVHGTTVDFTPYQKEVYDNAERVLPDVLTYITKLFPGVFTQEELSDKSISFPLVAALTAYDLFKKDEQDKRNAATKKAIHVAAAMRGNTKKNHEKAMEQLTAAVLAGDEADKVNALKEKVLSLKAEFDEYTAIVGDNASLDTAHQSKSTHPGKSGKPSKPGNKSMEAPKNHKKFHPSGDEQASGALDAPKGKSPSKPNRKPGKSAHNGNPDASVAQLPPTEVDAALGDESGAPNSKPNRKPKNPKKPHPSGAAHARGAQGAQEGSDAVEPTVGDDNSQ